MFRKALLLSYVCAVCLTAAPIMAAEGRTPIFGPGPIVASGKYIVTRDIFGFGGAPAIDIFAPNVDIDLNGFTVDNAGGPAPAISVSGPSIQITIHNGTVSGAGIGIDAPGGGEKIVIEDVKVQGVSGAAIHVFDIFNVVVKRAVIHAPGGPGILIDGAAPHSGTLEHNVIRDAGGDGISFSNGSIGIVHNRIAGAGGFGILLLPASGCLVNENTVVGSGADGIFIRGAKGNKIYNNVVREGGLGIHLDVTSTDNLILNNVVAGNGSHGVLIEGDLNTVQGNTLNSNVGGGLFFTGTAALNAFGRNMARGNTGVGLPACVGAPAGLFPPNSCNAGGGNTTFGDNHIPGPPVF